MIEYFKSFILTLITASGLEQSVTICKDVVIIEALDTSKIEIIMPDTTLKSRVINKEHYPNLFLDDHGFLNRIHYTKETELWFLLENKSMRITFKKEGCLEN